MGVNYRLLEKEVFKIFLSETHQRGGIRNVLDSVPQFAM
jgi:hypothetical protein